MSLSISQSPAAPKLFTPGFVRENTPFCILIFFICKRTFLLVRIICFTFASQIGVVSFVFSNHWAGASPRIPTTSGGKTLLSVFATFSPIQTEWAGHLIPNGFRRATSRIWAISVSSDGVKILPPSALQAFLKIQIRGSVFLNKYWPLNRLSREGRP